MQNVRFLLHIFCFLFFTTIIGQQEAPEKKSNTSKEIFTKDETEYINKLVVDVVKDMELTSKVAINFQIITSYYGLKMSQLGEDPSLTKIEIIAKFNELVNRQNLELKQFLTKEQHEDFSGIFKKLSWSVNKRLNQL